MLSSYFPNIELFSAAILYVGMVEMKNGISSWNLYRDISSYLTDITNNIDTAKILPQGIT